MQANRTDMFHGTMVLYDARAERLEVSVGPECNVLNVTQSN